MSELPAGWALVRLGEVLQGVEAGRSFRCIERPPTSNERGVIKVSAVSWGRFLEEESKTVPPDETVDERARIKVGDLLFSRANTIDLVGACVLVDKVDKQLYLSDKILRLNVASDVKRWIYRYLGSQQARKEMSDASSGNQLSMRNISQSALSQLSLPIAPEKEQVRIADKLDFLFARVDACRERLDRVHGILKRFRQAVLAAATSGTLTREWRESHGVSLDCWRDTVFENACTEITVGYVGKMAQQYQPTGVPFLRSLNVRPFKFDPMDIKYVSYEFHKSISKSALKPGDVVVVRTGNPGQCCVIPDSLTDANCSDLVIVRPAEELDSEFAVIFINAETSQSFVRSEQVGVAQAHFNVGSMKKTPLRMPPKTEQAEIVRRVKVLFSAADLVSSRCESLLPIVTSLTPASLAKAFRGELVPQDPKDEPAYELLSRIRAVGTESPTPKRGRKPAADKAPRAPREKSTMAKTRNDEDVRNKDYLASLLRKKGGSSDVEMLFKDAELSVTDFYKQLAWEIEHDHIRDDAAKLEVV